MFVNNLHIRLDLTNFRYHAMSNNSMFGKLNWFPSPFSPSSGLLSLILSLLTIKKTLLSPISMNLSEPVHFTILKYEVYIKDFSHNYCFPLVLSSWLSSNSWSWNIFFKKPPLSYIKSCVLACPLKIWTLFVLLSEQYFA